MLLINVKGTFDHVGRHCLLQAMEMMNTDGDLMRWTEFLIPDRCTSLVIDCHMCKRTAVETGVLQESLVSPVLFASYLSEVFRELERELEACMDTSFTDHCRWLVLVGLVEQLCERLETAGIGALEWGERNHMAFDNCKDGIIAFTLRGKPDHRRKLTDPRLNVRGYSLDFNT